MTDQSQLEEDVQNQLQHQENNNQSQAKDGSQVVILKNRFDFVFLVPLKHIDSDVPLEQLIILEHELADKNITQDEIKTLLESPRSLLILDGYDEYKKGTNSAIDAVITDNKINSFVLITSRPNHMDKIDKNKVDGEIQNKGLSVRSVMESTLRYIENAEKAVDFLKKAVSQELSELLRIPILLLMMCVLYIQKETLPKNRAKFFKDIIDMYIMRAEERGVHFDDKDKMLLCLGELCYEASERDTQQLLIRKVSLASRYPPLRVGAPPWGNPGSATG